MSGNPKKAKQKGRGLKFIGNKWAPRAAKRRARARIAKPGAAGSPVAAMGAPKGETAGGAS